VPGRERTIPLAITVFGLLAAASAPTAGAQCPNLSGAYVLQGEDGQVHISIRQRRCDSITVVRKTSYLDTPIVSETHALMLDGKAQPDVPWYGESPRQVRTSAKFVGSELVIEAKAAGDLPLTVIYSLNSDRDLQEESVIDRNRRGNRRASPSVAKRQR
jgi:hypothetical protein